MADYIEREPLLKAFKEKCCQDCPGGYSHQQCHSWCDAASEIEMIENAPAVNNTPQQWQNSRLHPPTEADADRTGGIIVWAAASRHLDVVFWQNVVLYPEDLPFWIHEIGISLTATTFDLSKPLAAMAERAKQDGFEFYYTRHIAEDVFELELRRDYIGVKTKVSAEYLQKYIPHSCLEGFLMGEYDRLSYSWELSPAATMPRRT